MVYLYDNAIINDLRRIITDNRITITPFENLIRTISKSENDVISLPIVSITRTNWTILSNRPHAMKFDGALSDISLVNQEDTKVTNLQAIPIRINYLIDVWTRTRLDNDNLFRELIFYYSTNPTLKIQIPYGIDANKNFNIIFDNDVEDNSDIINHKNIGEHFRQTLSFYVDDAYLWKSSYRGKTIIDTDGLYLDINNEVREKIGD